MKTRLSAICLTLTATTMISCHEKKTEDAPWILDRFDDIKILRYEVSGFAELPLREKELIYYLAEAAKCGATSCSTRISNTTFPCAARWR